MENRCVGKDSETDSHEAELQPSGQPVADLAKAADGGMADKLQVTKMESDASPLPHPSGSPLSTLSFGSVSRSSLDYAKIISKCMVLACIEAR